MTRRPFSDPGSGPTTDEGELPRPGLTPDALAALHRALASLTPKQRLAVELHFFEGLSQGEIARRLGLTQQVIQKRLHGVIRRGRRIGGALPRLRAALARLPANTP
jgi:DNA-directed RNA polymerase specialized sigma24 family protein